MAQRSTIFASASNELSGALPAALSLLAPASCPAGGTDSISSSATQHDNWFAGSPCGVHSSRAAVSPGTR